MLWTKRKLKQFGTLLSVLSKLLSLLSAVLQVRPSSVSKRMRRVLTADKISVGIHYFCDEKEVGNIRYNMADGYFCIFTWPSSFSALRKAQELLRLLSFAIKIIRSEKCN